MAITIDDIAKECGVSKRTVSRVINNSPYVNPKTREKVKKVIQKYNYNANILAKNLAKGKGFDLIGLITGIEDLFGKYYFMEIIHNIEKYLEEREHSLFIINLLNINNRSNKKKLKLLCNFYHSKVIKGFIVLGPPINDNRIKFLSKNGVKGIVIGSKWVDNNFGYIDVNNKEGVNKIITHFIECGHKKIAIINGPKNLTSAREREEAYYKTLKDYNIDIREEYITYGAFTREGGRIAAKKLFELKDPPTAIFAANDDMAFGVYDEAQALGFKIPEDISIAGFDNIDASANLDPPLTTISQPFMEIGELAANSIIKQDFNIRIELPVALIKRESIYKL